MSYYIAKANYLTHSAFGTVGRVALLGAAGSGTSWGIGHLTETPMLQQPPALIASGVTAAVVGEGVLRIWGEDPAVAASDCGKSIAHFQKAISDKSVTENQIKEARANLSESSKGQMDEATAGYLIRTLRSDTSLPAPSRSAPAVSPEMREVLRGIGDLANKVDFTQAAQKQEETNALLAQLISMMEQGSRKPEPEPVAEADNGSPSQEVINSCMLSAVTQQGEANEAQGKTLESISSRLAEIQGVPAAKAATG